MALTRFVLPLDRGALRHHSGGLLQLLGTTLLVPTAVALVLWEPAQAGVFAALTGGSWLLGWILRRGGTRRLGVREAMALTAFAYVLFAAVGALAFLLVASPVDAFFEAMSGFTTTGLTVLDVQELPRSLLFFRGYSQWVGGAGIIVLSLVILAGPGSAGAQLYTAEFGQQNLLGSVVATGRLVVLIYGGLTVAGFLALWAAGAGLFDAVVHGLSLVSTGGFSPFPDSFGAYDRAPVAVAAGIFMAVGATSLPLFYLASRHGPRRLLADAQLRTMVALIGVGTLAFVLLEGMQLDALAAAAFHVTSAVTTTGFVLEEPSAWNDGARLLTVGLMVVGGSLGSSAGGLKVLRLLVLFRMLDWALSRVTLPGEAQIPLKVGRAVVHPREVRHTFALTGAYLGVLFVGAVALTGAGITMEDAVFEAASGLSTVGLSAGVTSPDLPAWAKLLLSFMMWAGRVEILAVLLLFHPLHWLRR